MGSFTASTLAHDAARSVGDMESMRMGVTKIYKGDLVLIKTDGYAYSAYSTGATGDQFVGVAAETVDNTLNMFGSAASAGDKEIRVWLEGEFEYPIASGNINTVLGVPCYNDRGAGTATPQMVTVTAGAHACKVGNIVKLNGTQTASTSARVRISSFSAVAT